jgi:glutathione reductase (NADPH)
MLKYDVDLLVIGAGSGGTRAARIAASFGARVLVAEEHRIGGTCVIRGCVPKKLMMFASRVRQEAEDAAGLGWRIPETTFDWATFIQAKDQEISRLEKVYATNLEQAGVEIVKERADFVGPNQVELAGGARINAKHVLIATGATPHFGVVIPGIEHVISSNEVFGLSEQPKHILIQGGGYIALEFACIFSGLGSRVTVVHRSENVLRGFDDDVRVHIRNEMEKQGIACLTNCRVVEVRKRGREVTALLSDGSAVVSDQILFAMGRRPNVARLDLERAGVKVNPVGGGIAVDEFSRTSAPNIYAVGDVTNRLSLTPIAILEGQAFAETVFGGRSRRVDHSDVPTAVFSQPEIGTIGLTEGQARTQYETVEIYKTVFRPMKATISGRDTRTLMKLVVDAGSDRVLGCHIVGDAAAEIIQIVGIAVKMKATKADFDATIALHPSAAEELVTMGAPSARHVRVAPEYPSM